MKQQRWTKAKRIAVLVSMIGAGAMATDMAYAQLSTATIKGQVTVGGAPAKAATQVTAVNSATGVSYKAVTLGDGSYVLPGLPPGSYEIRVAGGAKSEAVTVHVGDTAAVDLSLAGASDKVVVVGNIQRADVKSSEVGTRVDTVLIDRLPQINRNFLGFADLAPGVRTDDGHVRSGAVANENANVYIDGVSQKAYALRGGVSGQTQGSWSSPGNPFPQAAIAEYKVISQNYKAEYDQLTSAAITAVTKSGTNEFHGDVFYDHTSDKLTQKDPFQKKKEAEQGIKRLPFTQDQYGFSAGGPIVLDRIHYFMSYEAKNNENSYQAALQNNAGIANAGVMPSLVAQTGSGKDKFKEDLFFGRLDWVLSDDQRIEATAKIRQEDQKGMQGEGQAGVNTTKAVKNEETRIDVRHIFTAANYTNELHVGYEKTEFNPYSGTSGPSIRYLTKDWATILVTGGVRNVEDKTQKAVLLQDDFTYTGIAGHTIKSGVKYKMVTFGLMGSEKSVVEYLGFVGADGMLIDTALNPSNYLSTPYGKLFATPWSPAVAPGTGNYKDNMFGIYLQDDWQVNKQLELNLGLRWDYESNMLNNGYVMPADRVAALYALDTRNINGATAPAGQTYAQSIAKGGINIADYIGTGSRKPFKGAFAPRLGFSYDVKGDKSSVVYGGWGRAYDRSVAELAQLESFNNNSDHGEIWGLKNNYKAPYSDQLSIGLRQQLGIWNGEVAYTNVQQHNHLVLFEGNRDFNGGFATSNPADPLWGGPNGYGNLVLGDFSGRSKTDTLFIKLDKPYSKSSGWGASFAYTNSNGQTTNAEGESDNYFSWTSGPGGKYAGTGFHRVNEVEKHRVVATGVMDLPYEFAASGKLTWGSGLNYTAMSCDAGCYWYPKWMAPNLRVDAGLSKKFSLPNKQAITLRADVVNLFNKANYTDYGRFPWDSDSLQPRAASAMRTIKVGARYSF